MKMEEDITTRSSLSMGSGLQEDTFASTPDSSLLQPGGLSVRDTDDKLKSLVHENYNLKCKNFVLNRQLETCKGSDTEVLLAKNMLLAKEIENIKNEHRKQIDSLNHQISKGNFTPTENVRRIEEVHTTDGEPEIGGNNKSNQISVKANERYLVECVANLGTVVRDREGKIISLKKRINSLESELSRKTDHSEYPAESFMPTISKLEALVCKVSDLHLRNEIQSLLKSLEEVKASTVCKEDNHSDRLWHKILELQSHNRQLEERLAHLQESNASPEEVENRVGSYTNSKTSAAEIHLQYSLDNSSQFVPLSNSTGIKSLPDLSLSRFRLSDDEGPRLRSSRSTDGSQECTRDHGSKYMHSKGHNYLPGESFMDVSISREHDASHEDGLEQTDGSDALEMKVDQLQAEVHELSERRRHLSGQGRPSADHDRESLLVKVHSLEREVKLLAEKNKLLHAQVEGRATYEQKYAALQESLTSLQDVNKSLQALRNSGAGDEHGSSGGPLPDSQQLQDENHLLKSEIGTLKGKLEQQELLPQKCPRCCSLEGELDSAAKERDALLNEILSEKRYRHTAEQETKQFAKSFNLMEKQKDAVETELRETQIELSSVQSELAGLKVLLEEMGSTPRVNHQDFVDAKTQLVVVKEQLEHANRQHGAATDILQRFEKLLVDSGAGVPQKVESDTNNRLDELTARLNWCVTCVAQLVSQRETPLDVRDESKAEKLEQKLHAASDEIEHLRDQIEENITYPLWHRTELLEKELENLEACGDRRCVSSDPKVQHTMSDLKSRLTTLKQDHCDLLNLLNDCESDCQALLSLGFWLHEVLRSLLMTKVVSDDLLERTLNESLNVTIPDLTSKLDETIEIMYKIKQRQVDRGRSATPARDRVIRFAQHTMSVYSAESCTEQQTSVYLEERIKCTTGTQTSETVPEDHSHPATLTSELCLLRKHANDLIKEVEGINSWDAADYSATNKYVPASDNKAAPFLGALEQKLAALADALARVEAGAQRKAGLRDVAERPDIDVAATERLQRELRTSIEAARKLRLEVADRDSRLAEFGREMERLRAAAAASRDLSVNRKVQLDCVEAERVHVQAEKDNLQTERDHVQAEKDNVQADKDNLQAERDHVRAEKDNLQAERDHAHAERACRG